MVGQNSNQDTEQSMEKTWEQSSQSEDLLVRFIQMKRFGAPVMLLMLTTRVILTLTWWYVVDKTSVSILNYCYYINYQLWIPRYYVAWCRLQDYLPYQINLTMLTQLYLGWGGEPLSDKNKLHLAQINRLVTLVGSGWCWWGVGRVGMGIVLGDDAGSGYGGWWW